MSYYFSTMIAGSFDEALSRAREALQQEGFGVISAIDIQQALREKIGVDFRRYTILGACNPAPAHEALQLEDKVGTMLPCNVAVQEKPRESRWPPSTRSPQGDRQRGAGAKGGRGAGEAQAGNRAPGPALIPRIRRSGAADRPPR